MMFIGHYGAAFAMRVSNPNGPRLGALFLAAQAVDFGFFGLSLFGIEKSAHNPNLEGFMPIDLYYMPFTHSLLPATLIWAVAGAFLAMSFAPKGQKAAFGLGVGLVIASHWFIDLLVHRPDLGVLWETPKLGFGIWNYPVLAMALEITTLAIPLALYVRKRGFRLLKSALPLLLLVTILLVAQAVNWFTPAPTELLATAIPPLLVFSLFALLAMWADRSKAVLKDQADD
jgi:hypothetical protein